MPIFKKNPLVLAVSLASFSCLSPALHAEETAAISLEEIVVTAQKREQNMQDTPISMAAFTAETMQAQGIADISDAGQYMPNVLITESSGGSTGATIGIRGSVTINPAVTWEPTVGMYVDGVFVAKNVGGLFDVAELERMEVLRGPQGTLYGKNTIGGAINLITKKPAEEFGGKVRIKTGNYNYVDGFVSVDTGKVGDVASFNIALNKRQHKGFYENTSSNPNAASRFKKLDSSAARFAALFDVADNLSIYYTYDFSRRDNTPTFGQFDLMGSRANARRNKGELDGSRYDDSKTQGHALHITWDISDSLLFKSISAYRAMEFNDATDYDGFDQLSNTVVLNGTPHTVGQFHTHRDVTTSQYSQEFQLVGHEDFVDYVVGLYFFKENSDSDNLFLMGPGNTANVANWYGVDSESVALFGQADWHLTEALTLTTGLRYTHEAKEAYLEHQDPNGIFEYGLTGANNVPRTNAKHSWNNVSPVVILSYLWDSGVSTYFKVAQGWKAGGFNGEAGPEIAFTPAPTLIRTAKDVFTNYYNPEKVTSYELGIKSRLFNNRLQANIAIFHDRITDMQVSNYMFAYSDINNAGKAVRQGVETDFVLQATDNLTLNASYSYLSKRYKKYQASSNGIAYGDQALFPYAPRHSLSVGAGYEKELSFGLLKARVDYSIMGDHYIFDKPDNAKATRVDHYGLLNARIALAEINVGKNQTIEVGLWGKNLTDSEYRVNGIPVVATDGTVVGAVNYYGDPRTFGADVSYKF